MQEAEQKDVKLMRVEKLGKHLEEYFDIELGNPFSEKSSLRDILKRGASQLAEVLEKILGKELYIRKALSPLERVPARFHRVLRRLAAERVIKNVSYKNAIPDWPRLSCVVLQLEDNLTAAGCAPGDDYDTASVKALAECLERHSLITYDAGSFIAGSYSELKSRGAINPRRFCGFSEKQLSLPGYEIHRVNEHSKFYWTKAVSLADGSKNLLPAQLIYLNYKFLPEEPQIRKATTNGAAAGYSPEMSRYNAVCELIERDSFMIHWLNKIAPARILPQSIKGLQNDTLEFILGEYKRYDIDISVFDITTDLEVPTFMVLVRDKAPGRPSVYVSLRTDLDVEKALIAALSDGLRAGLWTNADPEAIKLARDKSPHLENLTERHNFWCKKLAYQEVDFLFGGPEKEISRNEYGGTDYKKRLARLKEILENHHIEVYLIDVTSPIAKEFEITVTVSLSPDLYPLYLNEHFKYLGIPRLYAAPVNMGILNTPKKEEDLNIVPHPFL